MPEPLLGVNILNSSSARDIDVALLAGLLDHAYAARRKKPACLDLAVMDDAEIARLNRRHLGRDEATDVLSFDDGEDEGGRLRLGDVAISAETARREAAERSVEFNRELAFYALHGLFHLLGMRDDDDKDRAEMLAAQARAMREYGLGAGDELL